LLNRVKRILGTEPERTPFNQKMIAYLLSALLIAFIGWYNPGNVIVKKLGAVREPVPATETVQTFTTPSSDDMVKEAVALENDQPVEQPKKETGCPGQKDPYKKLEQIIELTTDAKLAALSKQLDALPEQMAGFVNQVEDADYTMSEGTPVPPGPPMPPAQVVFPYVPGTSFYFQAVEDTSLPKKYVMTVDDIKAKEAMEKSMQALQQLNWQKLEMVLKAQGMKVNIEQVQQEMAKAMQQVDWKKLNEESNQAVAEAREQVEKMQQDAFVVRLGNFQHDRTIQQERIKKAQQQILIDRLAQRELLKKLEDEKKKEACTTIKSGKKKKIVHI